MSAQKEYAIQKNFTELFTQTLDIFLKNVEVSDEDIRIADCNITSQFKVFNVMGIDFQKSENLCAYFFAYSTLNSGVAYNRFLDAFKNCVALRDRVEKNTSLNVISLGGGPSTDMIGFCTALQEAMDVSNVSLNLTVVDLFESWKSFFDIIQDLLKEESYGSTGTIFKNNVNSSKFMCNDLREKPSGEYKHDLNHADIVLLVRVLDALNYREDNPAVILKNIVDGMNDGALLLLIDCLADQTSINGLEKVYYVGLPPFSLRHVPAEQFDVSPRTDSKAQIAVYVKKK